MFVIIELATIVCHMHTPKKLAQRIVIMLLDYSSCAYNYSMLIHEKFNGWTSNWITDYYTDDLSCLGSFYAL